MYRVCSKCKNKKDLSDFNKDKNRKDGYRSQCKTCIKDYYRVNKERHAANMAEYYRLNKDQYIEYYETNKEQILDQKRKYRDANKEKFALRDLKYRKNNKDQIAVREAKYRRDNKDKMNAKNAKNRANKFQATPAWLTKLEHEQITEFYTCAQMFKLYTGQDYHVDHIVPLQGKNVCGLHVPWNLRVIPAKENQSKSNKLLEIP